MASITEFTPPNLGNIVLFQAEDGRTTLDVQLKDETVWLSQAQMAALFQTERSVVTKHINNIFKSEELVREAVCAKFAHTAADHKTYQTNFYNLDVIIAVGYRINAKRGTQFRIWATSVLKEYLVRGAALNQRRLAEKGIEEVRGVLALLADTLEQHRLVNDAGLAVLDLVRRYATTWKLLLEYDEDRLTLPATAHRGSGATFDLAAVRQAIDCLRAELAAKGEATDLLGRERGDSLAALLGAIHQTFGGQDLYPGIEEKAAHLLYFVIKDHPFTDGNKRIGSFLFLLFLETNGLADSHFDKKGLVALALLIAASDPAQKELMIRLIVNLLDDEAPSETINALHG